ncbi:hypothetical protein B4V02_16715 [Paenibacillus kribbensis]|uniref:Uncharacterized protein n=1 Tax=Paenibacillus kribbensis TaxID=172713 RepID=A0A222WR64_9BACL|nr:hypothetical protein [Paenibacillus kribbensis]ASR48223.1 hypothetical protein B4V02_16715 [Paenibacillus kribbensis]
MFINLQDGVETMSRCEKLPEEVQPSRVMQMLDQAFIATQAFRKALLLLDRYFLSVPDLERLRVRNQSGVAFFSRVPGPFFCYLRTPFRSIVAEATVIAYLSSYILYLFS